MVLSQETERETKFATLEFSYSIDSQNVVLFRLDTSPEMCVFECMCVYAHTCVQAADPGVNRATV